MKILCYMAGLIVTTVLILREGWILFTGSESPVMSLRKWKLKTSLCLSNDLECTAYFLVTSTRAAALRAIPQYLERLNAGRW